jgi:hypothetical protein
LARFHYLHEGRIFKIETASVLSVGRSSPNHRIEHFWLCERCVQTLSVVVENGVVTTRPLRLQLAKSGSKDSSGRKRDAA